VSKQPATELLTKIKPTDKVIRRACLGCGWSFFYTAKYILNSFRKRGYFFPSNYCNKCSQRKQKEGERAKMMAQAQNKKTKLKAKKNQEKGQKQKEGTGEVQKRDAKRSNPHDRALTHRPFAALSSISLKK
jgi:hypothetical protein